MYRHIEPRQILPAQTISGVTAVQSQIHDMRTMTRGSVQFIYGAGLSGQLAIYACTSGNLADFFDLQLGIPDLTGSAGTWGVDLSAYGYPYYMAVVTPTSGSATVTIWANAKGS